MKINNIKKIINNDTTIEVLIGIELDPHSSNTWELEAPNVLVSYNVYDDVTYQSIELVDKGMKVHGHEFTEDEEKAILNYLETKNIKKQLP